MTHTSTLHEPRVASALTRMFAAAEQDQAPPQSWIDGLMAGTVQEQADAAAGIYMPISPDAGKLLYSLVRAVRPVTVVEYGMSFGISTVHLAAAVRDNGEGRVLTTEMADAKITAARRTFAETGLDDLITVLEGDARETLASVDGPVDFVLLDGWKDLALPVLRMLEPQLAPGTLVLADDVVLSGLKPYLEYVRDPANGYETLTFPVEDGIEVSCRL